MEPCVFRVPFQSHYRDVDEATLLANAAAFFAPAEPNIPDPDETFTAYPRISDSVVSTILCSLIQQFDFTAFSTPQQLRNYVTNNLLALAAESKTESARLKALELLGKIKDIGLFEERSTVLIEHMTTDEIQTKLRDKVQRLREKTVDAETIDVTPTNPTTMKVANE
jgi:hypothetical protein